MGLAFVFRVPYEGQFRHTSLLLSVGVLFMVEAELAMVQNPNRTPGEHPNPTTKIE